MKTNDGMNAEIVDLLRMNDDNAVCLYAAARILELEAERDALRDSWRFIPCTERLPAQGVRVLVDINGTVKIAKLWKVRPQWETDDGLYYHGDNFSFVTGWLPLPEPPADGE